VGGEGGQTPIFFAKSWFGGLITDERPKYIRGSGGTGNFDPADDRCGSEAAGMNLNDDDLARRIKKPARPWVPNADSGKARHVFRWTQGGRGGAGPSSRPYRSALPIFGELKSGTTKLGAT
jgi:hypothetical protein